MDEKGGSAMPFSRGRAQPGQPWFRLSVAVIGLVYLVLGVAGFLTPETLGVGHETSRAVWIFSASVLLNLVHTVIGLLGLIAATRRAGALIYSSVVFVGFAGLTAYGILATAFSNPEDPVNVNWADNWLHGLTAIAGLVLAIAGTRAAGRAARARGSTDDQPGR
jgi:hypothetical protein